MSDQIANAGGSEPAKPGSLERMVQPPDDQWEDDYSEERPYCFHCNNTGYVNCYCGGDLCVCYNFGEYPCPKCGG